MGQALCELIVRYPAKKLPKSGGLNATLLVLIDEDSLMGRVEKAGILDTGEKISPRLARRLACEAGIIPIVLGGDSQPLDVGRERRLHTRYQRYAMLARDQGCRAEGCDRTTGLHAHHKTRWADGGDTNVKDGITLCHWHHNKAHDTGYEPPTTPTATSPSTDGHRSGYGFDVIRVEEYDPAWADAFLRLRDEYETALRGAGVPVEGIEHVGSTAVPGLAAKPVVDVDIVVREEVVPRASDVLVGLGFAPLGEQGIPQRWAFRAPEHLPSTHTYVVVQGSLGLRNHLAVRDLLRADPALRDEYAAGEAAGCRRCRRHGCLRHREELDRAAHSRRGRAGCRRAQRHRDTADT